MISKLLGDIARLAARRPHWLLASMAIPALLSGLAFQVPLDFSFAGLMDRGHPEVARYFEASERYDLGGLLPVLVEGPESQLDAATTDLAAALVAMDEVQSAFEEAPHDWLAERAPWIVDADTFDAWISLVEDPADAEALTQVAAAVAALEARRGSPPEGARLLVVTMADDSFEMALDAEAFPRVRVRAREVLARYGARAEFAGMPAIVTQDQTATLGRMKWLGPLSLLAVLVLVTAVERRISVLFWIAAALLLSVGTTLALIGWIAGEITLMESVFGVLVFGLGVDFALHLLLRIREEQGRGFDFETSLQRAVAGTGAGIFAAATTTGGAFLMLTFAPDPVFYRLGMAGGVGLLLCFAFLIVCLPAQLALVDARARRRAEPPGPPRPLRGLPGLAAVARFSARSPGKVMVLAALLVAWSAAGLPRFRYETNLERVFSEDIRAIDTARRIHALFGVDPGPWLVATEGIGEARRVDLAFDEAPLFERTDSLVFLFPRDRERRYFELEIAGSDLDANLRVIELAATTLGGEAGARAEAVAGALRALQHARAIGPPSVDTLPPSLAERLLGPDGEWLVYAYPADPGLDSHAAARERAAAQAIHPEATSVSALFEALLGTDRPWMGPLTLAIALFVAIILAIDLRSLRLVFVALAPAAIGSFVALGVLDWSGFAFNTVTLVGVPLLLGLGVDDGIHVVHRMCEEPDRPMEAVVTSVGRGIAMTTATTCASVAALLFTHHPGIESIAILLLVGLPLCLMASITLIPACAVLCGVPMTSPQVSKATV